VFGRGSTAFTGFTAFGRGDPKKDARNDPMATAALEPAWTGRSGSVGREAGYAELKISAPRTDSPAVGGGEARNPTSSTPISRRKQVKAVKAVKPVMTFVVPRSPCSCAARIVVRPTGFAAFTAFTASLPATNPTSRATAYVP
jgi:hypothetical protein